MIDLPKPGTYVVRAPKADAFAQDMVQHWLDSQEETPFKSCLWLTASPIREVRSMLEPYLFQRTRAPKGLEVVSVRNLWAKGHALNGIRQLCRSLDTLCVLQPALVVLEHAELWLNDSQEPLDRRNPMDKMRLLHQWALHAKAHVLTPVHGDLPEWSVFADGLADVDSRGDFEFRPWWPTQWGLQTSLWNDPAALASLSSHQVLDSQIIGGLKKLAQACHTLRFGDSALHGIHVLAHGELSSQDASVLLRLGADSVWSQETRIEIWLGLKPEQIHAAAPSEETAHLQAASFARDLHEVFMPGQLTVVSNPAFAVQGLMMMQIAKRWGMHCTITRLSLMRHMTAKTALRLANWSQATCMFTATREAIYVLKIWESEPSDLHYRHWLESCFRESLQVLFSGDIQFTGHDTQTELLGDLHEELQPLSVEDLMASETNEPSKLAELWSDTPGQNDSDRPWFRRMDALMKGTQS